MKSRWKIFIVFAFLAFQASAEVPGLAPADELEQGRRIYQEGILPSGKPLQGVRFDDLVIEGAAAACVGCHHRSGLGGAEGNSLVPPINSAFLFPGDEKPMVIDMRTPRGLVMLHEPHTDESLAKSIRTAMKIDGAKMNIMMPRYALSDTEMKALITYLHQLSGQISPGVSEHTLKFAIVIAPGVESNRRKVMLDMVNTYFLHRNASWRPGGRRMRMGAELIPRTEREWELAVWELQGTEDTWGEQLDRYYAREPVFALVSGLSNTTWTPVHEFCQHEQMPCLFPSVDLSTTKEDLYPFYFSKGTALEAEILAAYLRAQTGKKKPHRLVQVYRDDYVSRGAAQALTHALKDSDIRIEESIFQGDAPEALRHILKDLSSKDMLMFWLYPSDMAALRDQPPLAHTKAAYFSALLANDPKPDRFPTKWKPIVRLVYPFELPDKRIPQVTPLRSWLTTYGLPLVDERLQSEVLFDMYLLSSATAQMLDNLYRDYMVEQVESILSQGTNRTVYPLLGLGTGQRFVSKSGYIVRFDGNKTVAMSDRIVP